MNLTLSPEIQRLCDEYEAKRAALVTGEVAAIPAIYTVIMVVLPIIIRVLKGGKMDFPSILAVVLEILPMLGIPPELLELARTIIEMLLK